MNEPPAHKIIEGGAEDIDRVASLWGSMVEYHRGLINSDWPMRTADDAWAIRRPQYEKWIGDGNGALLLAVSADEPGAAPDGYAMVTVQPSSASWELGDLVGELESLVVAASARGRGVGSLLIAAARDHLRAMGINYWSVGVVEVNSEATRLYEREGFRPFYRQMLASVDEAKTHGSTDP